MGSRIVIVQGHPDPRERHFCHGLAEAYTDAACEADHDVRTVDVAELEFPLLRSQREFQSEDVPPAVREGQESIAWSNHLLIIYPLWLGTMPALLKGFLEQVFRPSFAMELGPGGRWKRLLKGRSARVVVTMGMPAAAYRWFYRAHSLRSLERNVLAFVGISPVRSTLIGMAEGMSKKRRASWLEKMRQLGARAR